MPKDTKLTKFKGLNNVSDPLRLGLGWLAQADNVDIGDSGALTRRAGYARTLAASITGAYATRDYTRLYIVDAGALKRVDGPTLRTGLAPAPMFWCEVNKDVYYTNGIDSGIIKQDDTVIEWTWPTPTEPVLHAGSGSLPAGQYQVACTFVMPDGRETGSSDTSVIDLPEGSSLSIEGIPQATGMTTRVYIAPANSAVFQLGFTTTAAAATWDASPDALGPELATLHRSPVPDGTHIVEWHGCVYVMEYIAAVDMTVVWFSEPLGFHLFDHTSDWLIVKGRGGMLASNDKALLIGTDQCVYSWDGKKLSIEANYGVVPGWGAVLDDDTGDTLFWTKRGVCKAMPFVNLTEQQVSVAPGTQAGAAIVRQQGQKKYVVVVHRGGEAFNQLL